MKYFTPELFVKLQECQDAAEFRSVNADWERTAHGYEEQLKSITPLLPEGAQRLVRLGSLHDAHVLNVWHDQTRLTFVLQEESERSRYFILTYTLVDPPMVDTAALPEQHRSPHVVWLYDEIDIDRETIADAGSSPRPSEGEAATVTAEGHKAAVFTHGILFSNGWELRLRFHQLTINRPTALLLTAQGPSRQSADPLQQSA